MARRKVSVDLVLEASAYLRESQKLLATTKVAEHAIEDLGDEADDLSRDLAQVALNADVAKHQIDDLGDEARGAALGVGALDRSLGRLDRGGIGRMIRIGSHFELPNLPHLRHQLIAVLVGGIVAAAPAIGAILAGAVTGAVGLGGIAGGIAAASKDPAVRRVARHFSDTVSREFFSSGDAFVKPTISALRILERGFKDLKLGDAFKKVAPFVDDVAQGIADMGRNFMPGFNIALSRAGPFLVVFARGLAHLGTLLGDFFNRLSRSEGALIGLKFGLDVVGGVIGGLGVLLEWLSNRFVDLLKIGSKVTLGLSIAFAHMGPVFRANAELMKDLHNDFEGWLNTANEVPGATRHMESFGAATSDAELEAQGLSDILSHIFGGGIDLQGAILRYKRSLIDLRDQLRDNKGAWEGNTKAALDNKLAILDRLKDLNEIRLKQIALTGDTKAANAQYQTEYLRLRELARQAGISGQKFDELAGVYNIKFVVRVTALLDEWAKIFRKKLGTLPWLWGGGKQHGGSMSAGTLYRVNEGPQQVEYFQPNVAGYALPMAPNGGQAVTVQLNLAAIGGDEVGQALVSWLRKQIKNNSSDGGYLNIKRLGVR